MQQLSTTQNQSMRSSAHPRGKRDRAEARGKGLGVFSVGLGLAQLLSPGGVARLIGVRNTPKNRLLMRALGARELLAGVALLTKPDSAGWLWARVAGDTMDLALLGNSFRSWRTQRGRLAAVTASVVGVTALDAMSAARQTRGSTISKLVGPIHVVNSVTVNRSPAEVYAFWRDLENLPRFMAHLESVKVSDGRSTWTARGPAGTTFSWQAEVVLDRPNECIAWRSLEGSTSVPNRGVVRFSRGPGGAGTEVKVELKYEAPGGALGKAFAKLFGEEPSQQIKGDLRRLKQVLETGEVMHSDASIHRGMHPARPSERVPANVEEAAQ